MQTPSTTWVWITAQPGSLVLLGALAVFLIALFSLSMRRRRSVVSQARSGENQTTFVETLTSYGFDAKIARTTYHYLRETQHVSLPLAANNRLDEDLGLDSVDVDGCLRDLMQLNGRLLRPSSSAPVTVEDLVRAVQGAPRMSEMAAA